MKSVFFIIPFVSFIFYSIFPLFSVETSSFKKAFLMNPNGVIVFKTKSITKDRIGKVGYGDVVLISIDAKDSKWAEIKTDSFNGFIPANESIESEFLIFSKPPKASFGLIKSEKLKLLSKPFLDSTVTSELKQFDIIEILGENNVQNEIWVEVKTENGKEGFLKGEIDFYDSISLVKSAKERRQLVLSGYALVDNPIYLQEPGKKLGNNQLQERGFSKKGEFVFINQSVEIDGIKYFQTLMQNPARYYKMQADPGRYNDLPAIGWISEKNCKYYSFLEFTKYTIENSNFHGDKSLMEKVAVLNKDSSLNFLDFSIHRLTAANPATNPIFFTVKLATGYTNSSGFGHRETISLVGKEDNKKYTIFDGNIENRGIVEVLDLDGDGIPEFYSHMNTNSMTRVLYTKPVIYGFKEGAYKEIPLPGKFLDNFEIDGNLLILNLRAKNGKLKQVKYKYQNAAFVEIK
jgi:hypothetical protein